MMDRITPEIYVCSFAKKDCRDTCATQRQQARMLVIVSVTGLHVHRSENRPLLLLYENLVRAAA